MDQKVLVVDDEPEMLALLRRSLDPVCPVLEAGSGPEALRLLALERPGVMLLDLIMPRMSGLEVLCEALRMDPTLRIMMLTGDASVESARRALEQGARAYITKPFDPESLCGEIRRLLADSGRGEAAPAYRPWRIVGGPRHRRRPPKPK